MAAYGPSRKTYTAPVTVHSISAIEARADRKANIKNTRYTLATFHLSFANQNSFVIATNGINY